MATLVKHIKKELELFKANSNLFLNIHKKHVDIRFLIDLFEAPKHAGRLMTAVIDHLRLGGYIKVEGLDEYDKFFHIDSYREVLMAGGNDVDSEEFDQRFLRIEKHLKKNGGVVGSMYLRTDFYHPGFKKAEVYAGDGDYILMASGSGAFCRYRHAVCVVGTAEVLHNEKKWKAFIYLESKNPERFTHDGTGFGIVLAKAMHKTYLLRV